MNIVLIKLIAQVSLWGDIVTVGSSRERNPSSQTISSLSKPPFTTLFEGDSRTEFACYVANELLERKENSIQDMCVCD